MLSLPSETDALLANLRNIPDGSSTSIYTEAIHSLLLNIWTTDWVKPALNLSCAATTLPNLPLISLFPASTPSQFPSQPPSFLLDPTIHSIILRSIRAGAWVKARTVTNPLAKYTFAIRAIMLREAHKETERRPETDIRNSLAGLQKWFTDKATSSTFTAVRSTQHLASAVARNQRPAEFPHIAWTESLSSTPQLPSEGTFLGKKFQVEAVAVLAKSVAAAAYQILKDKIFLGLNMRAEYSDITDNLSNSDLHYFFLAATEPDNEELRTSHRYTLLNGILASTSLRQEFITDTNPLTSEPIWDFERLKQWYRDYCHFNSLIAILVLITGGSPCRGTELTCIQYRNTPSRRRGLFYANKRLIVATQYSKMGSFRGHEKLVPHALDGLTTDLLLQRIIVADSFAQIVAHIAFRDNPKVKELIQSYLFVDYDRPLDTPKLSEVLTRYTKESLGIPMGIQRWRHFSISLRRKFCPEFASLAAIDDIAATAGATQAGHSHAVESRVYGTSQWGLIGYQEDTYAQLLRACSRWQVDVLGLRPGGEVIPFTSIGELKEFEPILSKLSSKGLVVRSYFFLYFLLPSNL